MPCLPAIFYALHTPGFRRFAYLYALYLGTIFWLNAAVFGLVPEQLVPHLRLEMRTRFEIYAMCTVQ